MRRALRLAERGRGGTSPNPMVGAVIVDDEGVVVGRGAHEFAGGPHAEIHALNDAGARARGATLYCTLEPCTHTGRTGPCAPRVVEAGIRRAVIAVEDPNPVVAGKGIALLRAQGVEVSVGVLREEATRLNRAFFTNMRRHRPFVIMKAALSADGYVAAAPGIRTSITGASANRDIHRVRAEVDAIAVGAGTVACDDPLLTARGAFRRRPLTRVVFDRRLHTSARARLLSTLDAGPVIIISTEVTATAAPDRVRALEAVGASLEFLHSSIAGDAFMRAAMERLLARGVTSVVLEGGPTVHRAAWDARVVDCVQLYVSARPLGDGGVGWLPVESIPVGALGPFAVTPLEDDVLLESYVHWTD
jgi:diaminohydroxyphosphoribosylaminopyrimidine deaminase/5-amino-6-(5-phosphoribosylamino)uracil reductase